MTRISPPLSMSSAQAIDQKGRTFAFILSLAVLMTILCAPWLKAAHAQKATESRAMSVLKFTTGVISAYAYHEVGHAIVAAATGTDLEWGMGTYNQPLGFTENADSDSSGLLLHASGLTTQVIASEIILRADSIDKNDNFVRGMMFWNIVNPVVYSLDYWFLGRANKEENGSYQGDLKGIEHYSDEQTANIFAIGMTALAACQGYRFVKTQDWAPEWIKSDAMQLSFNSQSRDSVMLQFTFDF